MRQIQLDFFFLNHDPLSLLTDLEKAVNNVTEFISHAHKNGTHKDRQSWLSELERKEN